MADENENFAVSKKKLATIILIILAVLVLAAAALVIWQSKKLKEAKQELQNLTSVTATSTLSGSASPAVKTATKTATVTATATSGPDSRMGEIKTVAEKFMSAKQDRNLEEAKPYVTDDFLKNNSQDDFAGTSSPSIGSFEIQSPTVVESGQKYSVDAIVYWKLNGQDSGTSTFNIEIIYSNDKFLVNSYSGMSAS